jgi:ketosteroid isomerase-like protein
MSESPNARAVRRFYEAFNAQDLDGLVALLHPSVELQTARGVRHGREEARSWAARTPGGGLEQRVVLERTLEDERGTHALALIRKQWWWHETQDVAHDEPEAALFTFADGVIVRWQPFGDRDEALALLYELGAAH